MYISLNSFRMKRKVLRVPWRLNMNVEGTFCLLIAFFNRLRASPWLLIMKTGLIEGKVV